MIDWEFRSQATPFETVAGAFWQEIGGSVLYHSRSGLASRKFS